MFTTQKELRRVFWATFPNLSRKKIRNYSGSGTMYTTDIRVAWCDWIDSLAKDGAISDKLAERATLD